MSVIVKTNRKKWIDAVSQAADVAAYALAEQMVQDAEKFKDVERTKPVHSPFQRAVGRCETAWRHGGATSVSLCAELTVGADGSARYSSMRSDIPTNQGGNTSEFVPVQFCCTGVFYLGGYLMILSDKTITKMLGEQTLKIDPMTQEQIQPASFDIRLGNTFSVVEDTPSGIITLGEAIKYRTITADTYLILPGQFVLATTMEYFELPDDLTAFVEGRSSLGRMGLFIQNAGWVDPGFKGEITLELYNANRCAIELRAGRRVGQLVFAKMDSPALNPYNGKYQGQIGATGSRVFLDSDK